MDTFTLQREEIHRGCLILVNQDAPYIPGTTEETMQSVDPDYPAIKLNARAALMLLQIFRKIRCQGSIIPVSGYRTMEEQIQIYKDSLSENGPEFTNQYVARPGCSEHQTGLAIDLGEMSETIDYIRPSFPYTGICQRFRRESVRYGFIERYTGDKQPITHISSEPWHFRYVGYPHSVIMTEQALTLEEYLDYIRDFSYGRKHLHYRKEGKEIDIAFLPARQETRLTFPDDAAYQISGNNIDGFIITLWRK